MHWTPYRPLLNRSVTLTLILWVMLRVALALLGGLSPAAVQLGFLADTQVGLVATVITAVDMHRARETFFHASIGTSPLLVWSITYFLVLCFLAVLHLVLVAVGA